MLAARSHHRHQSSITRQGKEAVSTMSAVDGRLAVPQTLEARVALVRAQLQPIRSRSALLESYRRESLCRLAPTSAGSPCEVLDLAYALRWRELAPDPASADLQEEMWVADE